MTAPQAVAYAYLGEFHSPNNRARAFVWAGVFPAIGLLLLPGESWPKHQLQLQPQPQLQLQLQLQLQPQLQLHLQHAARARHWKLMLDEMPRNAASRN